MCALSSIDSFILRRARLLEQMRKQGGGIAFIPTAPERPRNSDAHHPYRHDSDFFYLTGFTEPRAWLILIAGANDRALLFCRRKDSTEERWEGLRHGPEAAAELFGFDETYTIEELDELAPTLMVGKASLYIKLTADTNHREKLHSWLTSARAQERSGRQAPTRLREISPFRAEMRLIKDTGEIATMRHAAKISAGAHARAMRACRVGMHEYELEAELMYEFRRHGAQSVAYNSIVASGANACIMHYPAGNAMLHHGDLVLIDAGCELDSYASDITRTFPVNGRYSAAQLTLYEITLAAQEAAVQATAAGAAWNEPHEAAVRVLAQGMLDEKLLHGSLDGIIESRDYTRFCVHRTGHWLGLDVHDAGDYREPGENPDEERPWRRLQPGMMLTIEPGIYVEPGKDVPQAFWNIGIRIEDNALVTEKGCELITRGVPVQPHEIEALMRE